MVDQMVLKAQQWVNATYASVSGYNACTEDGMTGWNTIYSLIRGLQHELGIVSLSDNFGPTTWSLLSAYGNVGVASGNLNMRIIAEAALYCKGYSGGGLDGAFGESTQVGVTALTADMGLSPQSTIAEVTPKQFKALLTMDAYVLTSGGSGLIRTCQQWLNGTYSGRASYYIGPCDGHYSRSVQTALVMAIQYQIGDTDSQVDGLLGPNTEAGLKSTAAQVSPTNGTATWVRLFQTAVACNGYLNSWGDSGGVYTDELVETVQRFQEFCQLDESGIGDYQTNDMAFFPIYQEGDTDVTYFTYDQGVTAGAAACTAATSFGVPAGTVIYFAVDYDAIDTEITSYVIPYFQGVAAAVGAYATAYAVGVYGCRNVCIRLSGAGLTTRSFVSGMSTGYSGNLGFPLPDNWAFDQIRNYTVTSGTGTLELDNDIVSGRDTGVNSVTRPRDPNDGFHTYLIWLEARATQWWDQGNTTYSQTELVAQWLRLLNPVNDKVIAGVHVSNQVFGDYDAGFKSFVEGYAGRPDLLPLRDPAYLWDTDVSHFGAAFGAVMYGNFPGDKSVAALADFGSWGGDAMSVLGQCVLDGVSAGDAYAYAYSRITSTADDTFFGRGDYFADVDAAVLGLRNRTDGPWLLSDLFQEYYASAAAARARFATFFSERFGGDAATVLAAAQSMFGDMAGAQATAIRDVFWADQFSSVENPLPSPASVSADIRTAVAQAFTDWVVKFATT